MNNTLIRKFELTAMAAGVAAALATTAGVALAQSDDIIEEVVVTGIRASLNRALDMKRSADGIVDAISAEDISKFPDENVAESLQRLPGVSITRDKGEGKLISVRGLGPAFSPAMWNGRELAAGRTDTAAITAASSGAGRAFAFNVLPSELVGGLVVHKTLSADLVEGGIGGLVEIQTRKPLDVGSSFSFSAQGTYDEKSETTKPKGSILFSETFADDTMGILVGASYSERVLREDQFWSWGWFRSGIDDLGTPGVDFPSAQGAHPFTDASTFVEQTSERFGVSSSFQYSPNEDFDLVVDALYTIFDSRNIENRREEARWLNNGNTTPFRANNIAVDPATGGPLSATLNNAQAGSANEVFDLNTKTLAVGANAAWSSFDPLTVEFDISYSAAKSDSLNWNARYAAVFDTVRYTRAPGEDIPSYVHGVTAGGTGVGDPASYTFLDSFMRDDPTEDEAFSGLLDVDYVLGNAVITSLEAGVRFSIREKDQKDQVCTTICNDLIRAAYPNLSGVPLVESLGEGFFSGDSASLFRGGPFGDSTFIYNQLNLFNQPRQNLGNVYNIREETIAGYLKANYDLTEVLAPISGNFGVRVVKTDTDATGALPTKIVIRNNILEEQIGDFSTVDRSYTYVLPSFSAKYDLTDDIVLRGSISRSLTRPELDKLAPRLDFNLADPPTATSGNPQLDPFTAWNYDLSAEWYVGDYSIIAVAGFIKEIDGFVFNSSQQNVVIAQQLFASVTRPENASSATIKGVEFALQQDLAFLPEPLDGFGVILNYTYLDSKTAFDPGFDAAGRGIQDFKGLSDHTANAVLFYEKGAVTARIAYNYRSDYLERNFFFSARSVDNFGQLDASISYDLNDKFNLFVEGVVLNSPRLRRFDDGLKGLPSTIIDTSPRIFFGVRGLLW